MKPLRPAEVFRDATLKSRNFVVDNVAARLLIDCWTIPNLFHLMRTLPLSLFPFTRARTGTEDVSIMSWTQKRFTLPPKSRGCYLITDHVLTSVPEIKNYKVGLLNLFIQHTSCALSLNENCKNTTRSGRAIAKPFSLLLLMLTDFICPARSRPGC